MPDRTIGLVEWRAARAERPDVDSELSDRRPLLTARPNERYARVNNAWVVAENPELYDRWAELPAPPAPNALTIEVLRRILDGGIKGRYVDPRDAALLRAALDALAGDA